MPPAILSRILDYIDSKLQSEITAKELADAAFMSPFHFARLFRQSTGYSPYQFILKKRIDRATQLLNSGETDLSRIAHKVGFYDSSHLRRHFKKIVGVGPLQYQRLAQRR